MVIFQLLFVALCATGLRTEDVTASIAEAKKALDTYNKMAADIYYQYTEAEWTFNTNITDYNQQQTLEWNLRAASFDYEAARNLSHFNISEMPELLKREFLKIRDIGTAAQTDKTKLARLKTILSEMESIYSTAKVCLEPNNCMALDPGLTNLLTTSRDYDLLLKAWVGWRDQSGRKMKKLYEEFVLLSNEALAISGHKDTGEYWRSSYEMDDFEQEVKRLYNELQPLYEQLHAYVRGKLKAAYGSDRFPSSGHIPAHLLGNMWAQTWNNLMDMLIPFKGKSSFDITNELIKQNYTATKIFQTSDNFFTSLGLTPMPAEFWDKSMLEKPKDGREVVCHASAWDFYNGKDFRIKACTAITQEDFLTAHHEMGHVQYYLQYKNQPFQFKDGANAGFHEAVGDTMALSVQTPEHMHSIGLLKNLVNDNEADINFLMSMALQKIAFIPFGYLIDQWRWSVFRGDTPPDKYNEKWWDLRCNLQGLSPPVERSSSDFDPGAKYHIPANTPYIRYFVSFIIQFQFHEAACKAAGYTGPLHRCDIYNNTKAGKAIGDMLKLGSSKPWPEAMELLTGQRKMSAQSLIKYFEPLLNYLKQRNGDDYGWQAGCPSFATTFTSSAIFTFFCFVLQAFLCRF